MRNLAIIPARSGSKGLKDKNIKLLEGKPLMAYSIEAALKAGVFDEVMVSTDSEEYAQIARQYGASVPFLRSSLNARDVSSSWDTVAEILDAYGKKGEQFDTFCLLQPTSPLREASDIVKAYQEYRDKDAIAVVSVCECEHSPKWSNVLDESLSLDGFVMPDAAVGRQQFQTYYRLNGAIYIVSVREFGNNRFLYRERAYAYVMKREKSIDIDTEYDFTIAEAIMKVRHSNDVKGF